MNDIDNISIESISFIFADGYKEGYYKYAVNSLENMRIIPKEILRKLIVEKCHCMDFDTLDYCMARYMPFLFDNSTKRIQKFNMINNVPSKEEIAHKESVEMKEKLNPRPSLSEKFDNLFQHNNFESLGSKFNNLWNGIRK